MRTYTQILSDTFIQLYDLPEMAYDVLKAEEDCIEFQNCFMGKNRNAFDDLLDYREHKIDRLNISLVEFIAMCDNNIKDAFEKTFMQSFSNDDLDIVVGAVFEGKITLTTIYTNFRRNINRNIMRYVL